MDAHNAEIWIASVVIGIEPKPAQIARRAFSPDLLHHRA